MAGPLLEDVEEEINRQLKMIEDIAYNRKNPYMASSLSSAEIFWLRRMLLYLRYLKDRGVPKDILVKYYISIRDLLWLRVNENREGKKELIDLMAGLREQIQALKGGLHKWFGGGGGSEAKK